MASDIKISKDEIRSFKLLQIISKLRAVEDKLKTSEQRYSVSFEAFEQQASSGQENFDEWDDYLEWKAYIREELALKKELNEVQNADNFTITG